MSLDFLPKHIEALIFCASEPLHLSDIQQCLTEMFEAKVDDEEIREAVRVLQRRYQEELYAFELLEVGGGYQFMTKPAYQESIGVLLKQQSKKRLSRSALETLSIIAYRQPVTKSEIEQIRGVNCDYAVKKLLEKEVVEIKGKSESIGRPMLYGTSLKFLEYFGINDIKELPTPKDFAAEAEEIGEVNEE